MIVFLIFVLLVIAASSFPATKFIKKHKKLIIWDYIYPYTGVPLWVLLTMLNIGKTASLSNFVIENFWITIVSIITPWVILILYKNKKQLVAQFLTVLPIIFTITLRLLIETLPE
jgi:hypothetical protein